MEGPSLLLAANQLHAFKGKKILKVWGNTKIGKERLADLAVKDIFSWGKHLVFQFDEFAIRIHFLLFGTYTAEVDGVKVTGDYERKNREPRLAFEFENGNVKTYNCSIKLYEDKDLKKTYDFSIDIMSPSWDKQKALLSMLKYPDEEIADVLLDQTIFAGVGNIIKNEVLILTRINPKERVNSLTEEQLKQLINETQSFSLQFYEWRKQFVLRKHLRIHRKGTCPVCGIKVIREKTGKRQRWSYYCPHCQALS